MSGYNGWRNRETWLVSLWFEDSLRGMDARAIEAEVLDYVDNEIGTNGFIRDMLDLGCIDWDELEAHYAEEDDGQPDEAQEWADFDADC